MLIEVNTDEKHGWREGWMDGKDRISEQAEEEEL